MEGIQNGTVEEFRARIARFRQTYVDDWDVWLGTAAEARPYQLGVTLRKWQACRPNRMRRTRPEAKHDPPYLEDLVARSEQYVQALQAFEMRLAQSFSEEACAALRALWGIFRHLSYEGAAHGGLAGAVGVSKAVLLLSDGRVGPAFDSRVRGVFPHVKSDSSRSVPSGRI